MALAMPQIIINYEMPEGATRDDIAEFVLDALQTWGGQRHPDDPLFGSLRGKINSLKVNNKLYDVKE